MSTEPSPRAEQIQANVAAALSRLRGEPNAGTAPAAAPVPNGTHAPHAPQAAIGVPEILTKAEPLLDVGDTAPQGQPGIGAPDPAMALGARPADTPFERMTGLKMTGVKLEDQPDLLQDMGVSPPPLADLPDADVEAQRRRRRTRNRLLLGGFAVILLVGFWILSGGDDADKEIPTITADGTPERVKPEEEGGLTVPNQDVAILNNDTAAATAEAETVLPAPEQPATPPPPPEPVAAAPAVPAIPSVSAPEPTEIPAVAAPTELAPDAQSATQPTAEATTTTEPAATETTAEQPAATTETASAGGMSVKAAVQPVPGGKIRVQLASVKSEDGARQEWSRLQRAYPALLGGLELHVEKFEKSVGEVYYRVQAGPLGETASAKLICSELKQKNQACIVAK